MAYKFTNTHEEYLLQMLEHFYKKSKINIIDGFIIIDKEEKIHWFEFVTTELSNKILKESIYWLSNFSIKCIQIWPNGNLRQHPIEYLYEKYKLILDKQSFFKKTEHIFVEENEAKAELKEKKAKAKKENKK